MLRKPSSVRRCLRMRVVRECWHVYLFIYLYLKRTAQLAISASLPCDPLKHIYIYTQVKHMIKNERIKHLAAFGHVNTMYT